jgi:hypothetical protein
VFCVWIYFQPRGDVVNIDFRTPIEILLDELEAQAKAEIKAMGESARRSIGQLTRLDNFWRKA